MKLERYNQITIAIVSTVALVALLGLAVSFGVNLFSERSTEGIVIDRVSGQKPSRALVVCVPEHVRSSECPALSMFALSLGRSRLQRM